jgi:hypothetical protein
MSGQGGPRRGNVLPFPRRQRTASPNETAAFQQLTACLVMQRAREGSLDPAVVEYLLVAIGLCPPKGTEMGGSGQDV